MATRHEILKETVRLCASRALESKYFQLKYRQARKALKAYEEANPETAADKSKSPQAESRVQ